MNISLNTANLNIYKYLILRIQDMATSRGSLEQDPASPLGQYTVGPY